MARVKLRCIMQCPGLKSSYQEKSLLRKFGYTTSRATKETKLIIGAMLIFMFMQLAQTKQ